MSDDRISQVLGEISEDYLESALGVYTRKQNARKHRRNLAACAVVLALMVGVLFLWPREENYLIGSGLITVQAHGLDASGHVTPQSIPLEEGIQYTSEVVYDPTKSYRQHFPFSLSVAESSYPDMRITVEVFTNAGIFYKDTPYDPNAPTHPALLQFFSNYHGQHFTVDIDEKLYWKPEGFDYAYMEERIKNGEREFDRAYKAHDYVNNPSFIDVIIRADENIIGYCVIAIREINEDDGHPDREFSFEVLKMVNFPEVDGNLQNIPLRYVERQIQLIHDQA